MGNKQSNTVHTDRLVVKTTDKGRARITWRTIPEYYVEKGVMAVLYMNEESYTKLVYTVVNKASGSHDTSVPLYGGHQVRLHQENRYLLWSSTVGEEIWRGPEFDDANGEDPTEIYGYDALLQLFVKGSMACARLYIKKTFKDWKRKFYYSWVGFYYAAGKTTLQYNDYKYAVRFSRESRSGVADRLDYDVYSYQSGMVIHPGAQARFLLEKKRDERACTPAWD